jgi:hypothetical protein
VYYAALINSTLNVAQSAALINSTQNVAQSVGPPDGPGLASCSLLPLGLKVIRHCRRYTVRRQNVLGSSLCSFRLKDDNLSNHIL